MIPIPKISFLPNGKSKTFEIINLEDLMNRKNLISDHSPFELHRLSFNIIMLFTGNEVCHQIDFKKVTLKKNEAVILTKGQVHAFGEKENYKGYLILFNDEFFIKYLSHSAKQQLDLIRPFHLGSPKYGINKVLLKQLFEIKEIWEQQDRPYFEDLIANAIIKMLFHFQIQKSQKSDAPIKDKAYTRNRHLFFQFNAALQNSTSISRNAQFYANEMAITYKILNAACKKITGLTAKEYIDQIVILEAKRLIATDKVTVLETALASGFDDATNFSKYFKKQTGSTPGQFKSKFVLGQD